MMHILGTFVRMRLRIIIKINMLVDSYADSLSFKCYEDPFIGCWEIDKTKLSMHTYHFKCIFIYIQMFAHNLAHKLSKSKYIHQVWDLYVSKNLNIS